MDPATGNFSTYFPLIKDFNASVGGHQLPAQVVEDNDPNAALFFLGGNAVIYWAEFEMSFSGRYYRKVDCELFTRPY